MNYSLDWLKKRFDSGASLQYLFFWGHTPKGGEKVGKFVFSQWYPSTFVVAGVEYLSAEHWMMVKKAELFNDHTAIERILKSVKPAEAKVIGREIKNFDETKWNERRFDAVVEGNIHKFEQDEMLKNYLLTTGDRILVEASPVDAVWGIGLAQDAKRIEDPNTWKGLNLLGFALMEVRDVLRNGNS
ncbi:MAG TPA: NADAR family protein [Cyclobacteriaceae bacterium]|nr:NADAR family protein [Cyclobacteriaceae bacterium]